MLRDEGEQPSLLKLVDTIGQESGGKQNEQGAGDVEEETKVQPATAPVTGIANCHRHYQSDDATDGGGCWSRCL